MSESALDESMKAVSFIKLVYRKPPTRQVILHAFITTLSNKEKIKHNPEIVFFFCSRKCNNGKKTCREMRDVYGKDAVTECACLKWLE